MNAPDYRAALADLADRLQRAITSSSADRFYGEDRDALDRARTLLAAPEAVGVSDEEWDALVERLWDKYETVGYLGERFMYCSEFGTAMDLARKELSRFAHPAPVPVGERLPGVADEEPRLLRQLLGSLIDSLCLPGHGITLDEWKKACLQSGRYCEPFLSGHPAPVPVSERLPGVDDCLVQNTGPDGEPEWWCWFYRPGLEGTAEWRWNTTPRLSTWFGWQGVTHWRPYWALPLPTGPQP